MMCIGGGWLILLVMARSCKPLMIPKYEIKHTYCAEQLLLQEHNVEDAPLHQILCKMDPEVFPSASQSRKAIQHGRLLVLRANDDDTSSSDSASLASNIFLDLGVVANSSTILHAGDRVAVRSRVENGFYPELHTKYVDPPASIHYFLAIQNPVIFEDDHIAIVNKPEDLDCIGEKRNDLQSLLPFVLHPPAAAGITPANSTATQTQQYYLPRPVHRLDRKTSGCVLVAKSKTAMRQCSQLFATRDLQKSYCAITFGKPKPLANDQDNSVTIVDGKEYDTIDYPIDGKDAITLWRIVSTVISPTYGELSLVQCIPKTGRTHQIRRHLKYCLGTPIVGDNKYDGGGDVARETRELGMFLCSNRIEFQHPMDDKHLVSVEIPLPDKFYALLGINRGDVVI